MQASPALTPEKVAVDVYVTPREIHEDAACISGDVAVMVHAFCQDFAVPHLHRFNECCRLEAIKPPKIQHCMFFFLPFFPRRTKLLIYL
jgi:hypothetical protein